MNRSKICLILLLLGIGISVGAITPQLADAVAPPGGYWCTISGYLLDSYAGNAPIKYARVYFSSGGYATTNANGYYSKSIDIGQPTGMWVTVSTSPSGYYSQTKSRYCEPGGSYSLPFHFGRKLTFTGYVKSNNGQALASAPVKAYYKAGGAYTYKAGGSTNANGYYSLSFIVYAPCQEYRVIATPTNYHWEGASSTWSFSHTFNLISAPSYGDSKWIHPIDQTTDGQTVRTWAEERFQSWWLDLGLEYALNALAQQVGGWAGGPDTGYLYAARFPWKTYGWDWMKDPTLAADYWQIETTEQNNNLGDNNCYNRMILLIAALQSLVNAGTFGAFSVDGAQGIARNIDSWGNNHFWVQGGWWDGTELDQNWFWIDAWTIPESVFWTGSWEDHPNEFHGFNCDTSSLEYELAVSNDLEQLFIDNSQTDFGNIPETGLPPEPPLVPST